MSLLGELTYFLGLWVQQTKDSMFISQTKDLKQILKKYGMEDSKPVCTPMVKGRSLNSNFYLTDRDALINDLLTMHR